jgi:hypothetical protein
VGVLYYHHGRHAHDDLEEVVAEIDRVDPGWRLEDIEAARMPVPRERNAALRVLEVAAALPRGWPKQPLFELFDNLAPPVRPTAKQVMCLRAELQDAKALPLARSLATMLVGRFAVNFSTDFISTLLPHLNNARTAGNLLRFDALLRSEDADGTGAVHSFQAGLNAARSIGDEPLVVSQLVRNALQQVAIRGLERTLAQVEPAARDLAGAQELLADEMGQPLLLYSLRGERAGTHQLFTNGQAGKFDFPQFLNNLRQGRGEEQPMFRLFDPTALFGRRQAHAWLLRYYSKAVAIARAAPEQQTRRFQELERTIREPDTPELAQLLAPGVVRLGAASLRQQVLLRCGMVAVAVERYRQQHGRWPDKLADLVPAGLLPKVPADPYTGAALNYRKAADGVVVYSVGKDGNYQGDALDRDDAEPIQERPEFRLWNVDRRRQPPRPPQKPAEQPGGDGDPPRP